MASEPLERKTLVLRVSIHCEGCKKKVKKVLQSVRGVHECNIDARSNRVMVIVFGKVDANTLVTKLRKSGKQAELWPEEPKQQQPTDIQSQDTNDQKDEQQKPDEPAEKPGSGNAEANAQEQSNPKPSPEQNNSTSDTQQPAQESKERSNVNANANASANASDESHETKKVTVEQSNKEKGKEKQRQVEKPINAKVTVEYDQGSYVNHIPPPQPVHVMSYNVVRPSTSAAYYTTTPMPMSRSEPSQAYMDTYSPSYYPQSSSYEPHYYPQPSPYRYPYSSTDYHYYGTSQLSAFSPPRDTYGEMFNDENANSCSLM